MPDKTLWAEYGRSRITYHNYGVNLGYTFETSEMNLPISVGLGFVHNKIDYGKYNYTSEFSPEVLGSIDTYDISNSFSLGVGIDYYLKLNFGFSLKTYESVMGGPTSGNRIN